MTTSSRSLGDAALEESSSGFPRTSLSRRISSLRACLLMLTLRLTRLRNRMFGGRGAGAALAGRRSAPAARDGLSWLGLTLTLGLGLPLLTGYGLVLGRILPWLYAAAPQGAIPLASAHLAVFMFTALLFTFGLTNKDLGRLDPDRDGLLALPASIPVLYTMKVAERSLPNAFGWILIYPMLLGMITRGEFSWSGAAAALLLGLPLLVLIALAYVLVESAARVWLPRSATGALQLAGTVGGSALLLAMPTRPHLAAFLAELPLPAVSQAVTLAFAASAPGDVSIPWHVARYGFEAAVLLGAGYVVLALVTSRGAVRVTGAQGRRGVGAVPPLGRGVLRGMAHKELLQLFRDKQTLHLAFVLPCALGFPFFMLARSAASERSFASATHLPALAFLAGSLSLLSVANLLQADGKTLWLLFTFPRALTRILAERALVWVPICLGYASLVLAYGLRHQPFSLELAAGVAYCFVGLTLLVLIAWALGVHQVDPHAIENDERSTRGMPQALLLVVLLAAFGSGFYGDGWLRLSLGVLLGATAFGVWQEAGRRLPFLLEPDLRPAARVGVLDGLVCLQLITLLQLFGVPRVMGELGLEPWSARVVTFAGAVVIVGTGAGVLFRLRGVRGFAGAIGASWGAGASVALRQGAAWAALAAPLGVLSAVALQHWPWLREAGRDVTQSLPTVAGPGDWASLVFLTCFGAPLVEEVLFRGMIYRGLRESLAPRASALFTAGVFAAIHPSTALIPVFLLSLLATAAFERSRSLAAPIAVHAAYNTAVMLANAYFIV